MRKLIITVALSALVASPAFARGGHGGGGHCSHGGHGGHSHGGGHHGGSHASGATGHAAGFSVSVGHDGATGSQSTGSRSCNLRAWLANECRGR